MLMLALVILRALTTSSILKQRSVPAGLREDTISLRLEVLFASNLERKELRLLRRAAGL